MKRLLLFPATQNLVTLLRYPNCLDDYLIGGFSSFKEDYALSSACQHLGGENIISPEQELEKWDTLLLDVGYPVAYSSAKYLDFYTIARTFNKNVLVTKEFLNSHILTEKLETMPLHNPLSLSENEVYPNRCLEIPVPVVAICGLGENCSKFETHMLAASLFKEQGLAPLSISANPLAPLCGMYSFPEFMMSSKVSFREKIVQFNHHVYATCIRESPDFILITIPGGLEFLTEWQDNYYSEMIHIVSSALSVDASILNVYNSDLTIDMLNDLALLCKYKFDIPIDAFFMARQHIERNMETQSMDYFFFDDAMYKRSFEGMWKRKIPIINLADLSSVEKVISQLILMLENNATIV